MKKKKNEIIYSFATGRKTNNNRKSHIKTSTEQTKAAQGCFNAPSVEPHANHLLNLRMFTASLPPHASSPFHPSITGVNFQKERGVWSCDCIDPHVDDKVRYTHCALFSCHFILSKISIKRLVFQWKTQKKWISFKKKTAFVNKRKSALCQVRCFLILFRWLSTCRLCSNTHKVPLFYYLSHVFWFLSWFWLLKWFF